MASKLFAIAMRPVPGGRAGREERAGVGGLSRQYRLLWISVCVEGWISAILGVRLSFGKTDGVHHKLTP